MMNKISEFFHVCSGSTRLIIRRYPTENSKYAGIGATILFTGILAGLASGYAVYTVFERYLAAILFGLIWGFMIFNLDRYIVSSMRKGIDRRKEFWMASPRLILAILIALVISKPLELKIFEKEIENELVLMQQELRKEQENAVKARYEPQIEHLQSEIDNLKGEVAVKEDIRNQLLEEARKEADGTGGTGLRNAGPIYRLKKADADQADEELRLLSQYNDSLVRAKQTVIDTLNSSISAEIAGFDGIAYNGFASRLEAMDRITSKSTAILLAEWFIILLFIAIETAPIFVKLISTKGPYDDRLQMHEHQSHLLRTESMAHNSQTVRKNSQVLKDVEKEWLDQELGKALNLK